MSEKPAPEKVYVLKWALTQGILVRKGLRIIDDKYITVEEPDGPNGTLFLKLTEVAFAKPEAERKFNDIRDRKIRSLEKQMKDLNKLQPFYVGE